MHLHGTSIGFRVFGDVCLGFSPIVLSAPPAADIAVDTATSDAIGNITCSLAMLQMCHNALVLRPYMPYNHTRSFWKH